MGKISTIGGFERPDTSPASVRESDNWFEELLLLRATIVYRALRHQTSKVKKLDRILWGDLGVPDVRRDRF